MRFLLNGAEHKVDTYGPYVLIDDTMFTLNGENWNQVYSGGYHVYTLHYKTYTMEKGRDYQTWYDEDQIPVRLEDWLSRNTLRNIKNIIIDSIVYKIEGAVGPRPKLFLDGKHVGYIREGTFVGVEPLQPRYI
jgi:hypothetical protein